MVALLVSRDNEDLQTFDVGGCVALLLAHRSQGMRPQWADDGTVSCPPVRLA